MARINNNLETKTASKSEASAMNETCLTSAKSAKSAVPISEFGIIAVQIEIGASRFTRQSSRELEPSKTLARISNVTVPREASWTAVALRRFSQPHDR
jgi:hypothetical protein